jgi:hypothetical protein
VDYLFSANYPQYRLIWNVATIKKAGLTVSGVLGQQCKDIMVAFFYFHTS